MTILAITGTGTGVGKTVATAALACCARRAGIDIAVCKPVQTGTADGDDDLATIRRLGGIEALVGLARYPEPMAPVAAAQQAGIPLPTFEQTVSVIRDLDRPDRLVLVEGAGGLLVALGVGGFTLRDLAAALAAPALVVVGTELGTLNYTALTLEALAGSDVASAGLVIGTWPPAPGTIATTNRTELARMAPIRAVLQSGAGALDPIRFAETSERAFDRAWVQGLVG